MFRIVNSAGSAARAAAAGYLGYKTLELAGYGASSSLSNILQMNALGNFSLSLALGTTLELGSLAWLGFSGFRNATSESQKPGTRVANMALGTSVFTGRQAVGASIGFALFLLSGNSEASLPTYLAATTLGSMLFASGLCLGAEGLTLFGSTLGKGLIQLLGENLASIATDVQHSRSEQPR